MEAFASILALFMALVALALVVEGTGALITRRRVKECERQFRQEDPANRDWQCPAPEDHMPEWYRRYTS